MSNIVLQLSSDQRKEIIATYANNKVERNAPGVVFAAKLPDVAITAYKSGKVMFQGAGAQREASRFGEVHSSPEKKNTSTKGDPLPNNFANMSVIGSDETGTGDFFGPITVAAVYVPSNKIELLKELGVKDSKMLTDPLMRTIAPNIMASCPHSILILRNEKYNAIQSKGYSQGKMKAILHNRALANVLNKIEPERPDFILIDQFAERKTYYNYLTTEQEIIEDKVLFSTKAEQLHVSVAAASILARYAFLKEMDKLSAIVGFPLQKGASSKVDEMAARIWMKQGEETLRSISKWHFANREKARKIMLKKKY